MSYALIVDIGNSQIETGVFDKENLKCKFRYATQKIETEYKQKALLNFLKENNVSISDIEGGMIFSVVPYITRLVQIIIKGELGIELKLFNPKTVLKTLKNDVDDPNEIGQDLIADIIGGIHYYGYPLVISDLGTVTKNLIIDKDGVFQGVSFFPGVTLNSKVLSEMTAQLPDVGKIEKPALFYGKNTIDAMRAGIYYCHTASVKRFMARAEEEFKYNFKKVITGGHSNVLGSEFESDKYIVDHNLVLKGMNLIYLNQK